MNSKRNAKSKLDFDISHMNEDEFDLDEYSAVYSNLNSKQQPIDLMKPNDILFNLYQTNRTNNIDFNSCLLKKTITAGLFNMASFVNNISKIKQLITKKQVSWQTVDIVVMFSIYISIILQVVSLVLMGFSCKKEFSDEKDIKQNIRSSNYVVILAGVIVALDIFIDMFS